MAAIHGTRSRKLLLTAAAGVVMAAAALALPSGAAAGPSAPTAKFTPNARADAGQDAQFPNAEQNEPQVAVDQTGRAFVDWQSNAGDPSGVSSTADGVHFAYLGHPDPNPSGAFDADVAMATSSWPAVGVHSPSVSGRGDNGQFFGHLTASTCGGAIQIHHSTSVSQGSAWTTSNASCSPSQVDRDWLAAYTPPAYRGTAAAVSHTAVFYEYHDFAASQVFVTRSFDGGTTWDPVGYPAISPTSSAESTTFCNSIPSGIAVDQRGAHPGRVYVIWETSDLAYNALTGCDYTQAQPFDHIFLSYSDDIGNPLISTPAWASVPVFNDPCAPNPPTPPSDPVSCQDVSELFNSIAVDDAGNIDVAYTRRDISQLKPEYDVYMATSSDGGNTFATNKVNRDTGTHYEPWLAAGGNGGADVVYYRTAYVQGTGLAQKPAAAPSTAVWDVYMSQTLDGGRTFTTSKVSDAPDSTGGIYFGDICTTGIFCSATPPGSGWGADRILYDDFGVAIGPDGGARIIWTDARSTHGGSCVPGGTVSCQANTHVEFACQSSGIGLQGETITGCGQAGKPKTKSPAGLSLGLAGLACAPAIARRRRQRTG